MAYCLNANRIRILLVFLFVIVTWQVFRNWPNSSDNVSIKTPLADSPLVQRRVEDGTPVVVTVFYEALCSDSKNFLIKQLQPSVRKAGALIEYQLVPYGKATTTVNKDGSLSFECQHGQTECEANMYHACVIETSDEPSVLLDTIVCMIRNNMHPQEAMQRCTREHKVDTEQVQKCFDSPHGAELLRQYGEETHALSPPVTFIPTVTLDGAQGRLASILKDLLAEVCKIAGGAAAHPDVCNAA